MATQGSDAQKNLKEYLSQHSILIVDSLSSARMNLAAILTKMGAARQKMSLVGTLAEAKIEIEKLKPKLIFSDFFLGADSGLDLLRDQKLGYTADELKNAVFVLVTSNASQSNVARAAEEDVDTFIIKPYTVDTLTAALATSVQTKVQPSRYFQLIEAGKEEIFKKNYDEAIAIFEQAMGEHEEPTLACFYAGQAEFMLSAISSAEKSYEKGLGYNQIHYKCLIGMYDLLTSQKKFQEAYDILRKISQYFPASSTRLASVLRLAILTEHFEDMDGYYQIYLRITERDDELIKYMCSALVVTGKHYLRNKNSVRAFQFFESAAISAAGRTHFIVYAIEALVNAGLKDEAEKLLLRLSKLAPDSKDYQVANYLISSLYEDLLGSIRLGRKLVESGTQVPAVYEKLIFQSVLGHYPDYVETLFAAAIKKWPEKTSDFTHARASGSALEAAALKETTPK